MFADEVVVGLEDELLLEALGLVVLPLREELGLLEVPLLEDELGLDELGLVELLLDDGLGLL